MRLRALLVVAALGCTLAAQNRSPLDLANAPVPPGATRISYGTDAMQFGELRVPSVKGVHPVAIVVHGGCWSAQLAKMDARMVALDNMRPLAAALTDAGIATWNIEYRRLGNEGGGWPGTFLDVAHAADHVRALAKAHDLDLTRIIAIGHSSGGHLALWLAARSKLTETSELYTSNPLPLRGVVDLDGPGDLRGVLDTQRQICGGPVVTDLLGGSPEERPVRYHDASPIDLLPFGVRQELFAGQMFHTVLPVYESAASRAGDPVHASVLANMGHFAFIDPQSAVWPQVLQSVRRLVSPAN